MRADERISSDYRRGRLSVAISVGDILSIHVVLNIVIHISLINSFRTALLNSRKRTFAPDSELRFLVSNLSHLSLRCIM